ncbi:long-chain fatty acid--CoA ligase [Kistimonas asteriae]|uniref:long-chain fatty acid--CoA ligase n=1 Tax=Kistimonas asteriae TaxID=517724 RepID=UPI001BADF96B|nr:long-chain fatty acid--CoA ligase [Kistimonas asteriae]
MNGLMMDQPLLITMIMQHAEKVYPTSEIVSVTQDQGIHRYRYRDCFRRVRQLANAMQRLGMNEGDRIATLAWTDCRHLEIYYAIACAGAICHTVNPRLFEEQILYILNHAEDRWIFIDPLFVPLLEKLQSELPAVEGFVVLTSESAMPDTSLNNVIAYEALIADEPEDYDWPVLDEYTASSLCYTSGTTGNPKGVLYSHRSTLLHAMMVAMSNCLNLSDHDVVMPVVPMFHVNAWGMPHAAPMLGAKLVLPGPKMADGEMLQKLIVTEQVTCSTGVPTIWQALLDYLESSGKRIDCLQEIGVGGSASPASLFERMNKYGVSVHQGWGMTEMSPVGTFNRVRAAVCDKSQAELDSLALKQGTLLFGVQMKIVDEQGNILSHDGLQMGELCVRAPTVCSRYFQVEGAEESHDEAGWLRTGDIATIDADGYLMITDRRKDLIKSGGEWICSIELENIAMNQPEIVAVAVIAVPHHRWGERPLLVAVGKGKPVDKTIMASWYQGKVADWWIPDDIVWVEALPYTATGKLNKRMLREQYCDYFTVPNPQHPQVSVP